MKKGIVVKLFLMLFFVVPSMGQMGFDVSTGVGQSIYTLKDVDWINAKPLLGGFVSVAPRYKLNEQLSVVTNLQYITKGYAIEQVNGLVTPERRFSYIEVIPEVEYNVRSFLSIGGGFFTG